jgi:hypothetical protein
MNKNQKGFGVVEVILIVLAIFVFLVILGTVAGKNQSKTSNKSTTAAKTAPPKPSLYTTAVWAGYLKYSNDINKHMTSVSAAWNVPSATLADNMQLSSNWIGIGGYEGKDPKGLIQMGTDSDTGLIDNGVRVNYYKAFWECFPGASERIAGFTINAGDAIQANIAKAGADWAMTLTDKTSGQTFQKTVACSPEPHTAEWILEDVGPPGQSAGTQGVLPRLSPTTFSNLKANGKAPGLANMIQFNMTSDGTPKGTTIVAPSNLTGNGSSFTMSDARP